MYVYDYVNIKGKFSGWGILTGSVYKTQDCQNIINEKAKNGWRYMGFVPTKQRHGYIQELDLIFEKKIG